MKKKIILWVMLAAMMCSGLLSGCQLIPKEEELPVAPIIESNEVEEYKQVTVVRKDLVAIDTVNCKYEALQKEDLAFKLGGERIGNVYVQVGQTVEKGDLLAELTHDSLADQIKSQEHQMAVLRMQKSHLQALKTLELARQDAMIADLDAQLEEVNELLEQRTEWDELWKSYEEQLKQWELDMELWESQQTAPEVPQTTSPEETVPEETVPEETAAESTVPDSTDPETTVPEDTVPTTDSSVPQKPEEPEECPVEQTLEELTQQKDNLERSRRDQLSRKVSVTNSYDQQIDAVDDSLYVQQLRMDELEQDLEERRIYAGIHGIVSFIKMERVESFTSSGIVSSNQIGSGQRSVKDEVFITVMNTDSMYFTVSGEDAANFPVGTEVVIRFDKRELKATSVEMPEGVVAEEGKQYAYLKLETPDPSLKDAAMGSIDLITEQRNQVLCLPQRVIQKAEDQEFVYVLNEEGLKTMQEVTTGIEINGFVEILGGLKEGDSVIVE